MTDHGTRDPSLAPAVEGLHWARGGLDSLPLSSVLSIVELTFKAGIDIRDDSKPAGKLWKATLEYMLTLPGLESLFWGLSVESSGSVYLLLQWGSPVGWQTFQKSFGIGLVVGLLASPPFNRALRLRVDLCSAKTSYLDAFSFPFHARISTQEKKTIEDAVSKSLSLVVETSSAEAWLQWLELDVPANPRSEIAPGKAAEQSHVLVVLLARRSLQDRSLEVDILPLDVLAGTATKVTLGLIQERPRLSSKPTFQPLAGQSTEALFKLLPHRQYSQDSDLFRQKDVIASGSNSKYQQSLRAFPAPYGSYEPMGHLNQYSTLNEGEPHDSSNRKRLLMVVEVCWLQFKPGCININSSNQDGSAMKEFLDLGAEIARHSECEGVSWGSEEGSPDTLVMFISWKTFKTGMNTFNTFSNTVTTERFTSRFPNLATPPQVQRFPSSFVPDGSSLMELTSFYVPSEHLTKMLFEEAYAKFQRQVLQTGHT
ncbi:hypothetical protein ACEPPN_007519 [Leptodophora sp. 'Broadleaf-Isolate-01']